MDTAENPQKSLKTFWVIWFGQLVSVIGSGLTSFALGVWIYERTGQATPFAITALCATLPRILLMPLAGAWADRFNRRALMILSDCGAAVATALMAALLFLGELQVWHIYALTLVSTVFSTFQEPAYMASTTMLVPKKDLTRAAGIAQMGFSLQAILTPMIAGALYGPLGLRGIILIDAATFFFAVGTLLVVHIPQPRATEATGDTARPSLREDLTFGWTYLRARPGLLWMVLYFASVNFFLTLSGVLSGPLVLSSGSASDMGVVQMVGGGAMLLGGLVMSAWGGPKRRVPWLIAAIALASAGYLITGLHASLAFIAAGRFVLLFFIPFASALSQAVFQVKVPPAVQGRVFSIRAMIAHSIMPLAQILAGPAADYVFEPLMQEGGALGRTFIGTWLGVGPGRGIALLFIISWLFLTLESLVAFATPRIRRLESEIPDALPDDEPEKAPADEPEKAPADEPEKAPASAESPASAPARA